MDPEIGDLRAAPRFPWTVNLTVASSSNPVFVDLGSDPKNCNAMNKGLHDKSTIQHSSACQY